MFTADQFLEEIAATTRPIRRLHSLQRASNSLTPGELTKLYMRLSEIGDGSLCSAAPNYQFMTTRRQVRKSKKPQLQPHMPENGIQLYEGAEAAKSDKTLYILFSGEDGQFFLPFAVVLALLPAGAKDVLAARTGSDRFYFSGVQGLGGRPYTVSRALNEKYQVQSYDRVVVMGFSIGGFFALRIAEMMKADIGLSLAGAFANDALHGGMAPGPDRCGYDALCMCTAPSKTRLINLISSKNEFDVLCALRAHKSRPKIQTVHLVNTFSHDVLTPLLKIRAGRLFFKLALARNGLPVKMVSLLSQGWGTGVRYLRKTFGMQPVPEWYLFHKTKKPKHRQL